MVPSGVTISTLRGIGIGGACCVLHVACLQFLAAQVFANSDELHLGCDDALTSVVKLSDNAAWLCLQRFSIRRQWAPSGRPWTPRVQRWRLGWVHIALSQDPIPSKCRQTQFDPAHKPRI